MHSIHIAIKGSCLWAFATHSHLSPPSPPPPPHFIPGCYTLCKGFHFPNQKPYIKCVCMVLAWSKSLVCLCVWVDRYIHFLQLLFRDEFSIHNNVSPVILQHHQHYERRSRESLILFHPYKICCHPQKMEWFHSTKTRACLLSLCVEMRCATVSDERVIVILRLYPLFNFLVCLLLERNAKMQSLRKNTKRKRVEKQWERCIVMILCLNFTIMQYALCFRVWYVFLCLCFYVEWRKLRGTLIRKLISYMYVYPCGSSCESCSCILCANDTLKQSDP